MTNISKYGIIELMYFPPIRFFSKTLLFDKLYIEKFENYKKGSYRNRAYILGANGMQRLSIPLIKGKNEQMKISEVEISYTSDWQKQHWKSITSAYGNAPFFEHYAPFFEPFFKNKYKHLFDFNAEILKTILNILEFDDKIPFTESYIKNLPESFVNLRDSITPKPHKTVPDPFFNQIKYSQVFEEKYGFTTNLSILDLLFCTGPEAQLIIEKSTVK